jgi:hypothetical protein
MILTFSAWQLHCYQSSCSLVRVAGYRTVPNAGNAFLVQGDVKPRHDFYKFFHEVIHGQHPVRAVIHGVVGVHL